MIMNSMLLCTVSLWRDINKRGLTKARSLQWESASTLIRTTKPIWRFNDEEAFHPTSWDNYSSY